MAYTVAQIRATRIAKRIHTFCVANSVTMPTLDVIRDAMNDLDVAYGTDTIGDHNVADSAKTMDQIANTILAAAHASWVGGSGVPLRFKFLMVQCRFILKLREIEGTLNVDQE